MSVLHFGVLMLVTARAFRHQVVSVKVVAVVVGMGVFMRLLFVVVQVVMRLGQMQQDTREHDAATDRYPQVSERLQRAAASTQPMRGAKANTDPVRAAPNAR